MSHHDIPTTPDEIADARSQGEGLYSARRRIYREKLVDYLRDGGEPVNDRLTAIANAIEEGYI
jgi:hypothetical protein